MFLTSRVQYSAHCTTRALELLGKSTSALSVPSCILYHQGRWLEASGPLCFMTLTSPSVLLFLVAYPVTCLLPSAHGPCSNWTTRWYFVAVVGKCNRFWYGGCHGNKNSFASEEECMRVCHKSLSGPWRYLLFLSLRRTYGV
uniref:BPTI/Kunitz inhibitor domain-containing protein n=1 Tax=Amazona collaria TaxID=241587 RepID=A0A8B9G9D6_9PSIT